MDTLLNLQALPLGAAIGGPAIAIGGITLFFIRKYVNDRRKSSSGHLPPPQVPGLPVIGNLLQLKEKKPHKTFTKCAEKHGPIYSIKIGSNNIISRLVTAWLMYAQPLFTQLLPFLPGFFLQSYPGLPRGVPS